VALVTACAFILVLMAAAVISIRQSIRRSPGRDKARVPSRASLELGPDVAPGGAQDSFRYVLSHGWLAVGHTMSPLPWLSR